MLSEATKIYAIILKDETEEMPCGADVSAL